MKQLLTIIVLTFIPVSLFSQDTIRVMHYNCMYYGVISSYCTAANNPQAAKDTCLKKIIKYVKPDIFTANEVAPNSSFHQHILDYCLNVDGVTHYAKGAMTNVSSTDLSNGMFYNTEKLGLISQETIPTSVRDINIYNFYYKSWNLSSSHDTAYLTCIVMHLKAGSNASDISERATQTNTLMNYLNSKNKQSNYLVMGDFNVYTSTEECFQNLINYSNVNFRFYDPINMLGDWNNNYSYADYHTQSTHTSSDGCHATGGMDDRFDFILESAYIKNATDHLQLFSGSYKAIGQDGNHYNGEINSGTNAAVPDSIADALYLMSDHLPVTLSLRVDQTVGITDFSQTEFAQLIYANPVEDALYISLNLYRETNLNISIANILGQTLFSADKESSGTLVNYTLPVTDLQSGIYFLKITDQQNRSIIRKFVKK